MLWSMFWNNMNLLLASEFCINREAVWLLASQGTRFSVRPQDSPKYYAWLIFSLLTPYILSGPVHRQGWLVTEACLVTSDTMKAIPQRETFQVNSSSWTSKSCVWLTWCLQQYHFTFHLLEVTKGEALAFMFGESIEQSWPTPQYSASNAWCWGFS